MRKAIFVTSIHECRDGDICVSFSGQGDYEFIYLRDGSSRLAAGDLIVIERTTEMVSGFDAADVLYWRIVTNEET